MKSDALKRQSGELAIGSLIVIGLMVLGSALAVGSQEIAKRFTGDTRSRAACTPCGGNTCPDGWSYGPDGCWLGGSCDKRHEEACRGHQGGSQPQQQQPAPQQQSTSGGCSCDGTPCGQTRCRNNGEFMDICQSGGWTAAPSNTCQRTTAQAPAATSAPQSNTSNNTSSNTSGGTTSSASCASGWQCGANCATSSVVSDFNSAWCDGMGRWLYEAGCGGNPSSPRSAGCGGAVVTTPVAGTGGSTTSGGGSSGPTSCSAGVVNIGGCCAVGKRWAYTRQTNCSAKDECMPESNFGTSLCTADKYAYATPKPSATAIPAAKPPVTATAAPKGTVCSAGYLSRANGCCATGKSWSIYRNTDCSTENRCDYDNPNCGYLSNSAPAGQSASTQTGSCPSGSAYGCQGKNWGDTCPSGTTGILNGGGGRCSASGGTSPVCSCVPDATATVTATTAPTKTPEKLADWASCSSGGQCASGRCERDINNESVCMPQTYVIKKVDGETCASGLSSVCISGICAQGTDGVFRCQNSKVTSLPECNINIATVSTSTNSVECIAHEGPYVHIYRQCKSGFNANAAGTTCVSQCTQDGQALANPSASGSCCSGNTYLQNNVVMCGIKPYCNTSICLNGCSSLTTSGGKCLPVPCGATCNDSTGCQGNGICQSSGFGSAKRCICENELRAPTPPTATSAPSSAATPTAAPTVTRATTTAPQSTNTPTAQSPTIPTATATSFSTPTARATTAPTPTVVRECILGIFCWDREAPSPTPTTQVTSTPEPTQAKTTIPAPTAAATYVPATLVTPNTSVTPAPLPIACPKEYNYNECCGTGRKRAVQVIYTNKCVSSKTYGQCEDVADGDMSCGPREQYNTNVSTTTVGDQVMCPNGYFYDNDPPIGWSNCQPIRCDVGYVYDQAYEGCIPVVANLSSEQRTCDNWGAKISAGYSVCDGNARKRCINPAAGGEDQWDRITCVNGCDTTTNSCRSTVDEARVGDRLQ